MERAPNRPHSKYQPVYPILRINIPFDERHPTDTATVVEVLTSQESAKAEVARLNRVNAEKSCTYFYCTCRLVELTVD